MQILFYLFYFFTFISITFDAFVSPSSSVEIFGISSEGVLSLFVLCSLLLYAVKKQLFSKKFLQINRNWFLPISLALSALVIINHNYPNLLAVGVTHSFKKMVNLFVLSGSIFYFEQQLKSKWDRFIWAFAPGLLLFAIGLYHLNPHWLWLLITEDGPFEYFQAILYFVCFVNSLQIAKIFRHKKNKLFAILFTLLGIGFFFVAFEEISWGQRIIGVDTPEFLEDINYQKEITIHNLNPIQKVLHNILMAVGLYGAFAGKLVKKVSGKLYKKTKLFFPSKKLFLYFFAVFCFYFLYDYLFIYYQFIFGNITRMSSWHWQEVVETHLALGFWLYLKEVRQEVS